MSQRKGKVSGTPPAAMSTKYTKETAPLKAQSASPKSSTRSQEKRQPEPPQEHETDEMERSRARIDHKEMDGIQDAMLQQLEAAASAREAAEAVAAKLRAELEMERAKARIDHKEMEGIQDAMLKQMAAAGSRTPTQPSPGSSAGSPVRPAGLDMASLVLDSPPATPLTLPESPAPTSPYKYEHRVKTYSNGGRYEGQYNGRRHGQGVFVTPNGGRYEGQFNNGVRTGEGTQQYPDGSCYTGQWQRERHHGTGRFVWPSGQQYEGAYVEGKRHGYGRMVLKDGTVLQGEWADDLIEGLPSSSLPSSSGSPPRASPEPRERPRERDPAQQQLLLQLSERRAALQQEAQRRAGEGLEPSSSERVSQRLLQLKAQSVTRSPDRPAAHPDVEARIASKKRWAEAQARQRRAQASAGASLTEHQPQEPSGREPGEPPRTPPAAPMRPLPRTPSSVPKLPLELLPGYKSPRARRPQSPKGTPRGPPVLGTPTPRSSRHSGVSNASSTNLVAQAVTAVAVAGVAFLSYKALSQRWSRQP